VNRNDALAGDADNPLMKENKEPSAALSYGLMGLLCLLWGSTWLVIKWGLRDVPPFAGASARFVVAFLVMAALTVLLRQREGGERPPPGVVLAQGLCQFVLNYALVYLSETILPSGLVSVLWSVFPLMMAFAGHFVTRAEPLRPRQWLGFAVAFCGVVSLFLTDVAAISQKAVWMGLLLLLAPASVAYSTTLIKRRAQGASSLLLNRDSILIGALGLALLSVVFERPSSAVWSGSAVFSVLYLAIPGTVVTFGVYLWLLRYVPAYRLSLTAYITPVVALLLGNAIGDEPLRETTIAGTALVLGGVALTLVGRRAPKEAH
jgi:drug/metabolite transporter (DMT)-like permease